MNVDIKSEINSVLKQLQKEGLSEDEACNVFMAVLPSLMTFVLYYPDK